MKQKLLGLPLYILSVTALALAIALVGFAVYAWTGPTQSPPSGNVSPPINTGSGGQVKAGDFATLGKLGIGTASPGYTLDVNGGWIRLTGTGTSWDGATRIGVYDSNNTGGVSGWWMSQNQNGTFALHQNAVGDRLTIDGSGNVGIGTPSPGTWA